MVVVVQQLAFLLLLQNVDLHVGPTVPLTVFFSSFLVFSLLIYLHVLWGGMFPVGPLDLCPSMQFI